MDHDAIGLCSFEKREIENSARFQQMRAAETIQCYPEIEGNKYDLQTNIPVGVVLACNVTSVQNTEK